MTSIAKIVRVVDLLHHNFRKILEVKMVQEKAHLDAVIALKIAKEMSAQCQSFFRYMLVELQEKFVKKTY